MSLADDAKDPGNQQPNGIECPVQARRKVVTITPERKKGPQGNLSFEAMTDRSIELTDPTPADLGTALRAAYERTE